MMWHESRLGNEVYAEMSPELAAWVLRLVAKELERCGCPRWARLDTEELTSFLVFLGDAAQPRCRTRVPSGIRRRPVSHP